MAKKKAKAAEKKTTAVWTKTPSNIYQFKITLLDTKPPIWRRIQVQDGTLDQLHAHIQTAMGWTNSHLHHFEIGGERYGDPEMLNDGFMDDDTLKNSFETTLSEIVGKRRKGFKFIYEYDFGDSWSHGIEFEGQVEADPKTKYPICTAGRRACPPEDCGGVWGYANLLEVLANPKHEDHDEMAEWAGEIDPDEFSPEVATKAMRKGVIGWEL